MQLPQALDGSHAGRDGLVMPAGRVAEDEGLELLGMSQCCHGKQAEHDGELAMAMAMFEHGSQVRAGLGSMTPGPGGSGMHGLLHRLEPGLKALADLQPSPPVL